MIRLGPTSLAFLGRRSYLHSTEVFHLFCDMMAVRPADEQPVRVDSFKFLRETDRNGHAFLLDPGEELPTGTPKPVATFKFTDRGSRARLFAMTDDGPPIGERQPELS